MSIAEDDILAKALDWHLACSNPDMDWAAFTVWLEADNRHRDAFDQIALTDGLLQDHGADLAPLFTPVDANEEPADDHVPNRRGWKIWSGAAIAASLAAVLIAQQVDFSGPTIYATGAKGRTITLEDGSQIQLAPQSKMEISGRHGQKILLDGGAWFEIRHDPQRQLSVQAGGISITDIGTKFDVQSAAGQVRVEVGQGQLSVTGDTLSKPIHLAGGQGLTFDPQGGTAEVEKLPIDQVGEWRSGRLSFEAAPLTLVAADLNRYAGVEVTVAHNLSDRHFTGTLVIGDGEAALRDLSQLMGIELDRSGRVYRLESASR